MCRAQQKNALTHPVTDWERFRLRGNRRPAAPLSFAGITTERTLLIMITKHFVAAAALLAAVSVSGADNIDAKRYGTWGIDVAGMDRSVKPGDDFVAYSSGKWLAATEIPADKTSYGSFNILGDL